MRSSGQRALAPPYRQHQNAVKLIAGYKATSLEGKCFRTLAMIGKPFAF
jgi:hypothetical protein